LRDLLAFRGLHNDGRVDDLGRNLARLLQGALARSVQPGLSPIDGQPAIFAEFNANDVAVAPWKLDDLRAP
jgi:hypothetical protein